MPAPIIKDGKKRVEIFLTEDEKKDLKRMGEENNPPLRMKPYIEFRIRQAIDKANKAKK